MIIFGWIAGVLLLLVGLAGYFFCKILQPLHDAEVKMMNAPNGGKFEGEPDFMKTFRELRAEGEAIDNVRRVEWFRKVAFAGGTVLVIMFTLLFV